MNEHLPFQRARKPAEQQLRREAILAAAADLFDAQGPQGAGLNAIAAKAGFTKSNVYRYFESREEVLMSLFLSELEGFVGQLERSVISVPPGDIDRLAQVSTDTFIAHPRFCALIGILTSVLEQNVSVEKIIALKRTVTAFNARIAGAVNSRLPSATLEDCSWAVGMVATLVGGMWPNVTPSPAASQVLSMPEFTYLKPVPARDLRRAIAALFAAIV
ncbi:MAG: TetR family transcriptional regulator [Devosia sp.]